MLKFKVCTVNIQKLFSIIKKYKNFHRLAITITFIQAVRDKFPFFDKGDNKIIKYWTSHSRSQVITNADILFEREMYIEVYESLNKLKFSRDIEAVWRVARALYYLSVQNNTTEEVQKEMLEEAYEALLACEKIGQGKASYHKWLAIILNAKSGKESIENRIRNYQDVKQHLQKAADLNPRDFSVQYMLGKFCYEMADLGWLQRKIAEYMFEKPPITTYHEAYKYLIKAEELHPRSYLPNMYLLGLICIKEGHYYRAKYYLNLVLNLPVTGECGKCVQHARQLLSRLEKYEFGKHAMLENYEF